MTSHRSQHTSDAITPQQPGLNRRRFLTTGAAAAAGLVLGADPAAAATGGRDRWPAGSTGSVAASPPAPGMATTVEYAVKPLGTDVTRPRFGWHPPTGTRDTQRAYQLQVATSERALLDGRPDVWDSGRVASADTVNVAYGGPDLAPRTRYHWRVRSWTDDAAPGAWSTGEWFETGLLGEGFNGARWIGNAPTGEPERTLQGAAWIWTPGSSAQGGPTGTRYLRGALDLPADIDVAAAYLVMTADDYYTGYLAGEPILESAPVTDGWRTAEAADVTEAAAAAVGGRLVVAVAVTNAGDVSVNPGGLLAHLMVATTDGRRLHLYTGDGWRITETAPAGWQQPDVDDSGWERAQVLAPYGEGPWGSGVDVPQPQTADVTGAWWIWTPGSTPTDGAVGTRYLRGRLALPAGVTVGSAELVMTADDDFTCWLQGERVLNAPQQTDGWRLAQITDVTEAATAAVGGELVLAVRATNRPGASVNPGGLLGKLIVRTTGGDALVAVTDDSWRINDTDPDGWAEPDFDDSGWQPAAALAEYGDGPWGSGVTIDVPPTPAPLVRCEFAVDRPVRRARLYVGAAAYAAVRINGRPVSDAVLEPGFTDYDDTLLYTTHDVTELIRQGDNAIGAALGRGFYGMTTPNAWNWKDAPWHGEPRMIARLVLTHDDGSSTEVLSGSDWRIIEGPTRSDNLYAGESFDARLEPIGWTDRGFDDSGWAVAAALPAPSGRLTAQENEPIRVVDTVGPVGFSSPSDGVWVADFGRTVAGWTRLTVSVPAGTTVTLTHGERLNDDGTVNAANGNAPGRCQRDEYTAAGIGDEAWEPSFVYHGFRYVQIDGLSTAPTTDTVQMRVVHSDIADVGDFSCSEPLFETFTEMMRRTVHNNLHGLPTDTPMYEKNGWTGDAQVAAPTMAQLLAMQRLFTKWLGDLHDSQRGSGQPAVIVPSGGWGYTQLAPAPEWTTVYPFLLREMHRWYGDVRLLDEHYPHVVGYLDWELDRLQDGLAVTALGDYLSPGTGGNPPEDTRLTATAYLHRALLSTAEVGELVGDTAVPARYRQAAAALRDRLNTEFLDTATGHYRTAEDPEYRQTSNLIPLAFDLVPDEFVQPVFDSVVADIVARDNHLNTGCLGTSVLLPTLTRFGRSDLAAAVALQRSYPSWGYWVANGADTMWEFWQLPGRSRDHYFQGTVVQWLLQNVAGLRPVADGWRELLVRPDARTSVSSASHSLRTVRGTAAVAWRQHRRRFHLEVTVPAGSRAVVHVPAERAGDTRCAPRAEQPAGYADGYALYTVGGGRWIFTSSSA